VVESGSVTAVGDGVDTLNTIADRYSQGPNYLKYLMIISGDAPYKTGTRVPDVEFFKLLKKLGSPVLTPSQSALLRGNAEFSVIGIPGAPAGAATVRIPGYVRDTRQSLPRQLSPAITGYLQRNQAIRIDGAPAYDYVSPDYPTFDTRADGSDAAKGVMVVDGRRFESSMAGLAGATAGLHVVILDSLTLRLLRNEVLVTNSTGQRYTDRQLQTGAAGFLREWFDSPAGDQGGRNPDITVFVQTVGKPKAAGAVWGAIVDQLARLGANRLYVNALDGTSEYAVVGRLNSDLPPAEASTAYDHGPYPAPNNPPARIIGVLARTRTSTFEPVVSSTPTAANPAGAVNLELTRLAYQPLHPWPQLGQPTDSRDDVSTAESSICRSLGFCQATNSCPDVRSCYWLKYSTDWTLEHSVLTGLEPPASTSMAYKDAFHHVKDQLLPEIEEVSRVKGYLEALKAPFDRSATRGYVDLQKIGKQVYDSVQPPPLDNSTSFALGAIGKAVSIGNGVSPVVSAISGAFALAAYLSDQRGQPILGTEIQTKTSDLADQLLDRFDLARQELTGLGLLIVSDHDKLDAAARHILGDWALPADTASAEQDLRSADQQWFYEALVPTAYPYLIRGNSNIARSISCPDGPREGAWPNQPDNDQMLATVGYDDNGNPIKAIFFFTRGIGGGSSPPASIADKMFAPRALDGSGGLGIEKLSFFTPRVFNGQVIHAVNNANQCSVGWLPWRT
jgi:hypothetical protein